jgi:hypothetical protein
VGAQWRGATQGYAGVVTEDFVARSASLHRAPAASEIRASPFEALQAYRAGGKAIHSQREEEALKVGVKRINGTPCRICHYHAHPKRARLLHAVLHGPESI